MLIFSKNSIDNKDVAPSVSMDCFMLSLFLLLFESPFSLASFLNDSKLLLNCYLPFNFWQSPCLTLQISFAIFTHLSYAFDIANAS